jgi:dUTP pyrophosphatase
MKVTIQRIDCDLPLPRYETNGSVGFDLLARVDTLIEPGKVALIPGNIIVEVPKNFMLMLASRSSLPKKKGLLTPHGLGIIDHDFCGPNDEIHVQVYNFTNEPVVVKRGEKVAQGVFVHIDKFDWEEVDAMKNPSRGGFGSTGGYQKKGKFITFYGMNNVGKTTQAKLLVKHLKEAGHDVVYLKYPLYDLAPTGPKLNQILRESGRQEITEEVLQSTFMQNRLDFEPQLRKMLEQGKIVVAEDYSGTGIAWGTAKGLDQEWLEKLNQGLVKEDLAILLKGNRHLEAREKQHIHEENNELVEKVGQILIHLAHKYDWKIVTSRKDAKATAEEVWKVVKESMAL